MIITTCAYLFNKKNEVLLLHRIKKKNDINENKWIGVGGKKESNESIEECLLREVNEETNLSLNTYNLKAMVFFPNMYHGEDELMYLYTSHDFSGTLNTNCNEGDLKWVPLSLVSELNMWQGDRYFFDWFNDDYKYIAYIHYEHDEIVEYKVNRQIKL